MVCCRACSREVNVDIFLFRARTVFDRIDKVPNNNNKMLYCYIVLVLTNKKVGAHLALCESNMIHLYAIALFLPSKFTLHTNDCSSCSTPYNRSLALKQARFLRAFIVHTQRYAYKLAFYLFFFSSVRFSSKCAIFSGVSILCCVFCFSSSVFYRCVHSTSSFRTFSIKQTVFFVVGCFV